MVMASASVFEALEICGEPHTLITQRNLGDTQIGTDWICMEKESKRPPHRNSARAFRNARRS